jgi:hypothetical protein
MRNKMKVSILGIVGALAFVGCNGSSKTNSTTDNMENKPNVDPDKPIEPVKMQDYLLIGAKGKAGKGTVYKCNLDGTECDEFIGGNLPFEPSSLKEGEEKPSVITLVAGDNFGSSIFGNTKNIFIGSDGKKGFDLNGKNDPKSPNGAVYKCDLNGQNCSVIDTSTFKLITNDNFGSSLFATESKILVGAIGRDSSLPGISGYRDDVGSVFQFDLDGANGIEFIAGKNGESKLVQDLKRLDHLGTSIFATKSNIFIGSKDKNSGNGSVFKCNLEGAECAPFNVTGINLITNDNFGASLAATDKKIFVGAIGRDSGATNVPSLFDTGAVFSCNLDGTSCVELVGGQNKSSATNLSLAVNDNLGSSLAVAGDFLYIGAMGRTDNSGKRTGSVFKCDIEGTNCVELIGGKNKNKMTVTAEGLGLANGDLFGSSLAIVSLPVEEKPVPPANITNEKCSELKPEASDILGATKVTLCSLTNDVNKSNVSFVNAYSAMSLTNVILSDTQGSFRQIGANGSYVGAGTAYEYWGVGDWISGAAGVFNSSKKVFAFGEVGNNIHPSGMKIWDIRFVNEAGDILRAVSAGSNRATYAVEKNINSKDFNVADVFGAFVLPTSEKPANVYFLKKDGSYDVKDSSAAYKQVAAGKISELFPMIPRKDLQSVNFVQKLDKGIALYKKSKDGKYSGYYLVLTDDIISKNKDAKVLFVEIQ